MADIEIKVDIHREYVTAGFRYPVRFLGRIKDAAYPIVGVICVGNGSEILRSWNEQGKSLLLSDRHDDLVPKYPEYHDQWRQINVVTHEIHEGSWFDDQRHCSAACGDNEVPAHIEWRL
jgi:hypothetical protein